MISTEDDAAFVRHRCLELKKQATYYNARRKQRSYLHLRNEPDYTFDYDCEKIGVAAAAATN